VPIIEIGVRSDGNLLRCRRFGFRFLDGFGWSIGPFSRLLLWHIDPSGGFTNLEVPQKRGEGVGWVDGE